MSPGRSVAQNDRWKIWFGWRTKWAIILTLTLSLMGSAVGAASGSVLPSVDTGPQPILHSQIIGVLNVLHDVADGTFTTIARAPAEAQRLQAATADAWRSGDVLRAAIYCVVLLMIGGGAEWLYWCYAGKGWRAIAEAAAGSEPLSRARMATLGLRRALLSVSGVLMFAGGVLMPASIFSWAIAVQEGVVGVILAVMTMRIARIVIVLILSPHSARLRLLADPDSSARRLALILTALSGLLAVGAATHAVLRNTLGAAGLAGIASDAFGILVAGFALTALRVGWFALDARRSKRSLGHVLFPIALTTMILLGLLLHLIGAHTVVSTALLWMAAFVAGKILTLIVEAYGEPVKGATHAVAKYRPIIKSASRIVIFSAAAVATASIWNIPLLRLFRSSTLTGQILIRGLNVVVVALLIDLIWVWVRTFIDGKLAEIPTRASADGSDPSARLATLLPLLRKAVLGLLFGFLGLTALSALGINIGPLLAGAGVVGVAIGLGAQTLVRDVVSGVFYLVADSFRVGEYVGFGEIRGTVEGISLRFLRIRHDHGAIFTVPFGEIKWLVNLSRDWAVMTIEFRVPFETDLVLVAKIIAKIGSELMADPEHGIHMIGPLESLGVVRMEESSMVLNARCMTKPNNGRFRIRREAYHRIHDAFRAHGIRLSHQNPNVEDHAASGVLREEEPSISLHELSEVLRDTASGSVPSHVGQSL
jgi:small-conductance mechanosensitive channel